MKCHHQRLALERLEDRTLMSTCHVTRLSDIGAGMGFRGDLRYCINKVNAEPGADAIEIHRTGTINLTGALPNLSDDVAIVGPGAELLTVRRNTGGDYSVFTVPGGVSAEIYKITISNGFAEFGSGIHNVGSLILADVAVTLNTGKGFSVQSSGGVWNNGTLLAYSSIFSENTAYHSGGGLLNSTSGTMTLINCTIADNTSPSNGGGITNHGSLTIEQSFILGNSGSSGGGFYNSGNLTILTSSIAGNTASSGGAILGGGGTMTIRDTTIRDNTAAFSGGGIYGGGNLIIVNSTVSRNTALEKGGGMYLLGGKLTLRNSTVSGNTAEQSGGIGNSNSGAVNHFRNSIVAGNSAPTFPDFKGWLNTSGYNIFGNSSGGNNQAMTDMLDVDPMLGPLADNGGPTLTQALLPGSPALDAGDNADVPEFDQRGPGFPRIVNGTIDIGAFEVQSTPTPILSYTIAFLITSDLIHDATETLS